MSTGLPWKLYLALEGEPRQLIEAFATLREAALAFADLVGARDGMMTFTVAIDVGRTVSLGQMIRFAHGSRHTPYVIELAE